MANRCQVESYTNSYYRTHYFVSNQIINGVNNYVFYEMNGDNGPVTFSFAGTLSNNETWNAIAFNPLDDRLYALTSLYNLYSIDVPNNVASLITTLHFDSNTEVIADMSFDGNGAYLFVLTNTESSSKLYLFSLILTLVDNYPYSLSATLNSIQNNGRSIYFDSVTERLYIMDNSHNLYIVQNYTGTQIILDNYCHYNTKGGMMATSGFVISVGAHFFSGWFNDSMFDISSLQLGSSCSNSTQLPVIFENKQMM